MYFYFFKTSMEDRGNGPQPTLRALPNQKFPDGTPVDETLNVSAPKENGSSSGGTRFEYPIGTIFCSTFLAVVNTKGKDFYTVYDSSKGEAPGKMEPNFHPVSDDPNFQYVAPSHKDNGMNAAYLNFTVFGDQGTPDDEPAAASAGTGVTPGVRYSPKDNGGKARAAIEGWKPAYEDQIDTESELIATWMRKLLNENLIRNTAKRPKVDSVSRPMLEELYSCGESLDTIVSRARFDAIYHEQKMDPAGLQTIAGGPFEWYLGELLKEHRKGDDCTAVERDPENAAEVEDAAFIIGTELNRQNGTSDATNNPQTVADLKTALKKGWTIDYIMEPSVLGAKDSLSTLASALANGVIALPEKASAASGTTLLATLTSNKAYRCPTGKDGFHVNELIWNTLLVNLFTKTNTLLIGPTGSGKTQVVKLLCEKAGVPFTIIPMGSITDPTEQLVGKMDLTPLPNGNVETKYDWADFALAIQRPGVVLLDEVNRIPRNGYNTLFSVLDGTRQLPAFGAKGTDKRMIDVHPDCVFFATANIGYAGTEELDEALKNRFLPIELDYLPQNIEATVLSTVTGIKKEDATNIAIIAANVRKASKNGTIEHCVSTRETLLCARYVKWGFSVEQALEIVFLPNFEGGVTEKDPNCERGAVRAMIASRFSGANAG